MLLQYVMHNMNCTYYACYALLLAMCVSLSLFFNNLQFEKLQSGIFKDKSCLQEFCSFCLKIAANFGDFKISKLCQCRILTRVVARFNDTFCGLSGAKCLRFSGFYSELQSAREREIEKATFLKNDV